MITFVRFRVAGAEYALPVEHVREVRSAAGITPLPEPQPGVVGLLHRGNDSLTVLSVFASGAGASASANGDQVLIVDDGNGEFAVLVDEVAAVRSVENDARRPAPLGQHRAVVSGLVEIDGTPVLILDVAALGERLIR